MAGAGTTDLSSVRHSRSAPITLEISLRPGESYELPLTGRGSAGFSWSIAVTGDRAAVEAHVEGVRGPTEPTTQRPAAGSTSEQLVIRALLPGKATLQLEQRRSWEKSKPALAERIIVVNVRAQ